MSVVILRSVCVGVATMVLGFPVVVIFGLFIATQYLTRNEPSVNGGEIGWDLVTLAHNYPAASILLPLALFMVGFLLGYRVFSRSLAKK
ncbi:MAG TPA: hypothetical protein VEG64_09505 [Candidatus Sulfotelmatobacter sp.]|nr:hypothetical protein [Candidatus Sulfotelmatobacter sp.]